MFYNKMKSMQSVVADMKQLSANINESDIYEDLIMKLENAKTNGIPIEEGLLGAMVGGLAGATVLPMIMNAICKVLGIDTKGQFGNLLTSKLVLTAVGASIGWNK